MMEFLSSMKDSADYSLSMSELSSNKSTPNSLVTGRTLTASASDDSPKPSFKFKCRVRRKERNQITKWEAVRTGELCRTKRGLVNCVKHPFQTDHDDHSCEQSVGSAGTVTRPTSIAAGYVT